MEHNTVAPLPWMKSPVLPVATISDVAHAVPLARALSSGGISVIEVVLRTPCSLQAIERIRCEVPDITVGAGTLVTSRHVDEAVAAGAQFLVSPGATGSVCEALTASGLPALPGATTVSELMSLIDRGYEHAKLFPAESSGGVSHIRALGSVLPNMKLCPTGGIDQASAPSYLIEPNVMCVGGSWLIPDRAVREGRWDQVSRLAAQATAFGE
ncbi:bifunctional 4-hydroxy-2-oxoglutarate aldolase/2-dehydro-3-deoxy-phosphogluconate aldolase [Rhodococcus qingshengii]|uniref:bifunctional 4-hydroxy-2-oxoglutarate aldolase/2-dehydro-3-deoxy-phosphogluconate aldolase n=1 Tax=Rhodococcus qingshengii TaxID=334542 RepID=UPI0036DF387E